MTSKINEIQKVKQLCKGLIKQNNQIRAKSLVKALDNEKKQTAKDHSHKWHNFRQRKMEIVYDYVKVLKQQQLKKKFLLSIIVGQYIRFIKKILVSEREIRLRLRYTRMVAMYSIKNLTQKQLSYGTLDLKLRNYIRFAFSNLILTGSVVKRCLMLQV
jgi:hypothetical protein